MPDQVPTPPDPLSAMRKAQRIYSDPQAQRRADFAQNHPWLQAAIDLLTGGATAEPAAGPAGPADVVMAALPFSAGLKGSKAAQLAMEAGQFKNPALTAVAKYQGDYNQLLKLGKGMVGEQPGMTVGLGGGWSIQQTPEKVNPYALVSPEGLHSVHPDLDAAVAMHNNVQWAKQGPGKSVPITDATSGPAPGLSWNQWWEQGNPTQPKTLYGLHTGPREAKPQSYLDRLTEIAGPRDVRRQKLGYTTLVYHGTKADKDFAAFDPNLRYGDWGIHVTPRKETAMRATGMFDHEGNPIFGSESRMVTPTEAKTRIIPGYAKLGKELIMPDMGSWRSPHQWVDKLGEYSSSAGTGRARLGKVLRENIDTNDRAVIEELFNKANEHVNSPNANKVGYDTYKEWTKDAKAILSKHGYDTISYPNFLEGKGEMSHLLLEPQQFRSPHAAYDPMKATSPEMLAGVTGAAAAAGASQSDTAKENMNAILERYRRSR